MTLFLRTTSCAALAAALSLSPLVLAAQESDAADQTATDQTTTDQTSTDQTSTDQSTTDQSATDQSSTDQTATDQSATGQSSADQATDSTGSEAASSGSGAPDEPGETQDSAASPSPDMQAVLDKLQELGAAPISTLPPEEQRQEPTPADAAAAVMADRGIPVDQSLQALLTREVTYPDAGGGEQPIRIYTPPEGDGPFPLIIYFHGGGWVLADLDTYDASARQLAAGANAVVASVEYRHAPENPFPAAHEDANAAYEWIVENSGSLNADADRLAVVGESAGGNLALNVAIHARDLGLFEPDHLVLVYPVAGNDMETPSYQTYADAQPLSKAAMMWFVQNVFTSPDEAADPRINLVDRDDLAGLPPTTIINAQIDPLQSEGELLAQAMSEAGDDVTQMTYPGVTHEFFGMGAVVPAANEAMGMATGALRSALSSE